MFNFCKENSFLIFVCFQLVPLLLQYGAHIDQPNNTGICPADRLNINPFNLDIRLVNYISLKCLCSKVIIDNKIPYKYLIPQTLAKFVEMH